MMETIVVDYTVEIAVAVSSSAALVAAREARQIRKQIGKIDEHDRILQGDEATGFPGLVTLVTEDEEDDYGI